MHAKIKSLYIRRYRSIESSSVLQCGNLNVLIGKNNAGKSNLLATITLCFNHLRQGTVATPIVAERPREEFTDRDSTKPFQIGIEFELSEAANEELRIQLQKESPHLDRSIDQIKGQTTVSFVLTGISNDRVSFVFTEHISIGKIKANDAELTLEGIKLLSVPHRVAHELFNFSSQLSQSRKEIGWLTKLVAQSRESSRLQYYFREQAGRPPVRFLLEEIGEGGSDPAFSSRIVKLMEGTSDLTQYNSVLNGEIARLQSNIDAIEGTSTTDPMAVFAGESRTTPEYAKWLMEQFGSTDLMHMRETKAAIGRREAEQLLSLKVKRGGPERLRVVQETVQKLLGVSVDAFQSESGRSGAEMDVDEFLVEANGAGIREALRLILDLELKEPELVLIEEPEVHLHPGLEQAVHTYLREKSRQMQLFVTTHSTNFVDSVSFQNIYLISRNSRKRTTFEQIDAGEAPLKIPSELGLRLSTVFMFDRLVFVEGPSDEAVLREISRNLRFDITSANVGFVQMGGVQNFAHFAAEGSLDLLTRRRISMWFIVDRDERNDAEVTAMMERLGDRATIFVPRKRELENYLLDADAVHELVIEKMKALPAGDERPTVDQVRAAIRESAMSLRDEVVRLRTDRQLLKPVYLQRRGVDGTTRERLDRAAQDIASRLANADEIRGQIENELNRDWNEDTAIDFAPGSLILDETFKKYGLRFQKENGDSARLARILKEDAIPDDLKRNLFEISRQGI